MGIQTFDGECNTIVVSVLMNKSNKGIEPLQGVKISDLLSIFHIHTLFAKIAFKSFSTITPETPRCVDTACSVFAWALCTLILVWTEKIKSIRGPASFSVLVVLDALSNVTSPIEQSRPQGFFRFQNGGTSVETPRLPALTKVTICYSYSHLR